MKQLCTERIRICYSSHTTCAIHSLLEVGVERKAYESGTSILMDWHLGDNQRRWHEKLATLR